MGRKLEGIKPERVFYYFEEISKIPRCSYNEEEISNYLKEFGQANELETIQDEALNIIIKKPGTLGYENSPVVVLQGHMDMVCEKEEDSNHDFSKDPLELKVEGDYLKAKGTTLGADNGIAVAMGLAILEDKETPHPPLELLITTNEEAGMDGALALDRKNINGRILINIDSESEGTALVSCAGGEENKVTVPIKRKKSPQDNIVYSIKVSGLKGGHSGLEIHKKRGNANKILSIILAAINDECDLHVSEIEGGSKTNAIPSYGRVLLSISKEDEEAFFQLIEMAENYVRRDLKDSDSDFKLLVEEVDEEIDKVLTSESLERIIAILTLVPSGVQSMSPDIEGLVESSNNLGIVSTFDDKVTVESAIRSSEADLIRDISGKIKTSSEIVDGKFEVQSSYPAWEYQEESPLREIFKSAYKDQYGEELEIAAIHAGLECGIFKEKFGEIDMISFGPNMWGVHSPDEKLSISSTERTYELLKNVLKRLK